MSGAAGAPPPTREVVVCGDAHDAAGRAASLVADVLRDRLREHPWACAAFSGGSSPLGMFDRLAAADVPWHRVAVVQVDERLAPEGPDRNLGGLREHLLDHVDAVEHPMPVAGGDPDRQAFRYGRLLRSVAADPPRIDAVHLGLGADGHTASLVPGDPVLDESERDVAVTGVYEGRRRMTLTAPCLSRARHVVWLVLGEAKRDALQRLLDEDPTVPATRVRAARQTVVTDLRL